MRLLTEVAVLLTRHKVLTCLKKNTKSMVRKSEYTSGEHVT